jgi:uncharacterized Zn-finger protein
MESSSWKRRGCAIPLGFPGWTDQHPLTSLLPPPLPLPPPSPPLPPPPHTGNPKSTQVHQFHRPAEVRCLSTKEKKEVIALITTKVTIIESAFSFLICMTTIDSWWHCSYTCTLWWIHTLTLMYGIQSYSSFVSVCNKSYTDKKRMQEHMLLAHDGTLPFTCSICGKGFARRYRYNQHMDQHTGNVNVIHSLFSFILLSKKSVCFFFIL